MESPPGSPHQEQFPSTFYDADDYDENDTFENIRKSSTPDSLEENEDENYNNDDNTENYDYDYEDEDSEPSIGEYQQLNTQDRVQTLPITRLYHPLING
jgi:hypothetical protein